MVYLVTNQTKLWEELGDDIKLATPTQLLDYFKNIDLIDFDTETEGFDPYTCRIISAQFGDKENQFVVDTLTVPIEKFESLFTDKSKVFLMQHAKFDLKFLYHKRLVPANIYDTYLAECVLHTGDKLAKKGLNALTQKYLGISMDKSIRHDIHKLGLTREVIKYAAKDVAYLQAIREKQLPQIENLNLESALKLDNLYVKVLAYIEYSGFKLDQYKWKEKMASNLADMQKLEEELNAWVIDNKMTRFIESQMDLFSTGAKCNINWGSPKQAAQFFKTVGVNTTVLDRKTGIEKNSVDASVLRPQKEKSESVGIYLRYKAAEKVVSTYGQSFLNGVSEVSERIHTNFTQIMDTGRLSSGGKNRITGEEYINFQNIPSTPEDREEGKIYERDCFIPEEGYEFLVADYSGQEQVVLANQSMDKDLLEFYDNGLGDMHSFNASKIWPELGEDLKEIKKNHKDKRQIAKMGGFAINYGGNGSTVASNLNISEEEGERFYNAYMKAFPGLSEYWKGNKKEALKNGYVLFNDVTKRKSFVGFFHQFTDLETKVNNNIFWKNYREHKEKNSLVFQNELKPLVKKYFNFKGQIERKALNYPVQGTSADITKLAGIYIFKHLEEKDLLFKVFMPNVIHDEIMLEAPKELSKELGTVVKRCMEKAGERFYSRVKLTTDVHIGQSWEH